MSSYVIRHSFATHASLLDISLLAISVMLGHSSQKTTQIYLQQLPTNKQDEYSYKIMSGSRATTRKRKKGSMVAAQKNA